MSEDTAPATASVEKNGTPDKSKASGGRAPRKADWQRDVVYLFQLPRAVCVPSISPFCLKLETWLRIADIKYQNVNGGLSVRSSRGQVPFVELNGREICDSQFIIDALEDVFHKHQTPRLDDEAAATVQAFERLIEGSLFWVLHRLGEGNVGEMISDKVLGKSLPSAVKFLSPVVGWHMGNKLKNQNISQGIGRYTLDEAVTIGKRDLKALSQYLGKKKYLTGDTATRLDATAFGQLAPLWYVPLENVLKTYMTQECANLVDYLERIKTNYWPDWQRATVGLSMDSNWKVEDAPAGEGAQAGGDTAAITDAAATHD